jgi:hypothetical protein
MLKVENPYISKEKDEKTVDNAIMYIKKLDINPEKHSKWDVIYEGRKVPVFIKDEDFLRRVKAGEKFGNGDKLRCQIKIHQKIDEETGAFLDDRYEILNVRDIIRKNEQTELRA